MKNIKKCIALLLLAVLVVMTTACSSDKKEEPKATVVPAVTVAPVTDTQAPAASSKVGATETSISYKYASQGDVAFFKGKNGEIGLVDRNDTILIQPQFSNVEPFIGDFAIVMGYTGKYNSDERKGLINRNGDIILRPKYNEIHPFVNGYAIIEIYEGKDRFNYIDLEGNILLENWVETANNFQDSRALVSRNGKYFFIDENGKSIIGSFEEARDFSDGLAAVRNKAFWGYINKDGKVVINFQFDDADMFSCGLAAVVNNNRLSYIDKTGKTVIKSNVFENISSWRPIRNGSYRFLDNIVLAELSNGNYAFIDKTGTILVNIAYYGDIYKWRSSFSEGLMPVCVGKNTLKVQTSYIDTNGQVKIIVEKNVDSVHGTCLGQFSEGLAPIDFKYNSPYDNSVGYINKKGEKVISEQFSWAAPFYNGVACVQKVESSRNGITVNTSAYGYINKTGELISDYQWENAWNFSYGRGLVYKNNYYGFIDDEGKIVIPLQYYSAERFVNGYAKVKYNSYRDPYTYINTDGEIIAGYVP